MPKVYSHFFSPTRPLCSALLCVVAAVAASHAAPSKAEGVALLANLARSDSADFACGSLPRNAQSIDGKVLFQAQPGTTEASRIFQTDGTLLGTVQRLETLLGDHDLLGATARTNPIQYFYTASEDEIFTFNQTSANLLYLFTPPFAATLLGSFGGSELFGQFDPPSFWWSQGVDLDYSNVGQANGRFAFVDRTTNGALVGMKLIGVPNWRLSVLHPTTPPTFVGLTTNWTTAHPQPDPLRRNLTLSTNGGWSFVEVLEIADGDFDVTTTATGCSFLGGLVPVGDGQVLFCGVCPQNEDPGIFLVENGSVTYVRDTAVAPQSPIGTPIPSPPGIVASKPGDRLIIEIFTAEGYQPFLWDESTRALEPVDLLDHELLEPFYREPGLTLYRGTLDDTKAIWALDADGNLRPILEYEAGTSGAHQATRIADRILFYFDDGVHGRELWATDGTKARTQLVADLQPGPRGLQSAYCLDKGFRANDSDLPVLRPTVLGDDVLFSGYQNGLGIEPFTVPLSNFVDEEEPPPVLPEECDDPQTLCLRNGEFQIRTTWSTSTESGVGTPVELNTIDTGLFWFFQASNWELMVKVLDACDVNGHYWVLAGGTTDVGYRLEVERTDDALVWSRDNPLGQRSPSIIDVEAFPCASP